MKTLVRSRVWGAPIALGILMGGSLILALIGDGIWDALACLVLAGVLVYGATKGGRRNP